MAGEFERIARIRQRLGGEGRELLIGIGDDAAVLAPSSDATVLSVDAQVESVHFDRAWLELDSIGYRAMSAALSDLAAMGAEARAALIALILPASFSDAELERLLDGFAQAKAEYACPVAGGNLACGGELSITTTVVGATDAPLTRSGARAGDGLYVTGTLGAAALGLQLLRAGRPELGPESVRRFGRPRARMREGRALRGVASAAIDLSDGLLADLEQLCRASGVGCELELPALPLGAELDRVAPALGLDPRVLALTGGEDYELLFSAARDPGLGTRIGTLRAERAVRLLDAQGREVAPPASHGYDHFRGNR